MSSSPPSQSSFLSYQQPWGLPSPVVAMLTQAELDDLEGQIRLLKDRFRSSTLQTLAHGYENLLLDYRRIKVELEDAREYNARHESLAIKYREHAVAGKVPSDNSFVLVLVDGDHYLFNQDLLEKGIEEVEEAALLLRLQVQNCLDRIDRSAATRCRIVVRIYINLIQTSKALFHAGEVGCQPRALASLTAAFTASQPLMEIIDVGDKEGGTATKIEDNFALFAGNNQCEHIFFAACHNTSYLRLLQPYRDKGDQITLIRGAFFCDEFATLGLEIEEFKSVFRSTPLEVTPASITSTSSDRGSSRDDKNGSSTRPVCPFFSVGRCKFGVKCIKLHLSPDGKDVRDGPLPRIPPRYKADSKSRTALKSKTSSGMRKGDIIPLPVPKDGLLPLNRDGMRIDTYIPKPSTADWAAFNERNIHHRLCTKFHLVGWCNSDSCKFSHDPLESDLLNSLRRFARRQVCTKGGACRRVKCYLGHGCNKPGCDGLGCRFTAHLHGEELEVVEWVGAGGGDANKQEVESENGSSDLGW
ncbi:hypothetical protein EJ08DRAFT_652114 [Tothia fuscella]|uniref:C3H1-type domain-containing protein n=1 Tax=Tothia fuscella TaxID=1048955 RepID=A0A9P4NKV1_9PEZI|nr:hypothetical protein EJ08DRAFT_652114 [Tothia fuscella]